MLGIDPLQERSGVIDAERLHDIAETSLLGLPYRTIRTPSTATMADYCSGVRASAIIGQCGIRSELVAGHR